MNKAIFGYGHDSRELLYRVCALSLTLILSSVSMLAAGWAYADQPYRIGINFVESTVATPPVFFSDMDPFPLTEPSNYFMTQGGLVGWSEEQARRAVAIAVDDVMRDIDVGDPSQTVRIAVHLGSVPSELDGQHLNVLLGKGTIGSGGLLGTANQGSYDDVPAEESDTIVAVTFLDEIDNLGAGFLTYDTPTGVVNSIAGVAAHEVGHVFGADHIYIPASHPEPVPLMATEQTGLLTDARLQERRFSTTQPAGASNADNMLNIAGTAPLGDFNFDNYVDALDIGTLYEYWGMSDRLYLEGDTDGNHFIDAADFGILSGNFTGDPGPAPAEGVLAEYDPTTGQVTVSVDGVNNWYLESVSSSLSGNAPSGLPGASGLVTDNDARIGESSFALFSYSNLDLGSVAQTGLPEGDLNIFWNEGLGQPLRMQSVVFVNVPEPTTLALAILGLYGLLPRRVSNRRLAKK